MKISLNWLKTLIPLQHTPEEIEAILTASGLEVEHFETVESVRGGLKGLVVGEVKTCIKHPNADKLSLTTVDTGNGELLSIVCGAPNVGVGLKVIVAPVGTTIYPLNGEPFAIRKAKIRGEQSEGMLCAEDEIGLGESHAGLLILPEHLSPGSSVAEHFNIESDVLFEIGLTANRGDAASHIGVARELATVLRLPFSVHQEALITDERTQSVRVDIQDSKACPRYCGLVLDNITVKESPEWLKNRLSVIGLRPINNVVDITNFVLHELGQPLHAFDLSKIAGNRIQVRTATPGETFTTLDGVARTLKGNELMICDAEKPMCMAGIYGGLESGVSNETKSIFLESAYFSPDVIRKAAKQHGLSTDSSFRFERGTDPEMCISALHKAAALLKEYAGARVVSDLTDQYPELLHPFRVHLRKSMIRKITGIEIPETDVEQILRGLGIRIESRDTDAFQLLVPRFKSDVTREIDVIEEIIRIYGFSHIPLQKHLRMSLNYQAGANLRATEQSIGALLSANGFSEIMNNSLSSDKYYSDKTGLVYVSNPLSAELNIMRGSLLYGALESVVYNKNRKQENTRFFEFGKVYRNTESGFMESEQLIILASGQSTDESWEEKNKESDVYYIKSIVQKLCTLLDCALESISIQTSNAAEMAAFGLKDPVYYATINWTETRTRKKPFTLKAIPQFPVVRRDLSLVLNKEVPYSKVHDIIGKQGGSLIAGSNVFDVYTGKPLEANEKSISISIELSAGKTLTDADIDPVMNKLIQAFETELNAVIRK